MSDLDLSKFEGRLLKALFDNKLSIASLAEELGVTYEMVRRYTNGMATPRAGKIKAIASILKVDPSWLQYGVNKDGTTNIKVRNDVYTIQALNIDASAGSGLINSDLYQQIKLVEYDNETARTLFKGISDDKLRIISAKGDSMQGTFNSGDSLYVDISINQFDGDGIYVFTFGTSLFVKRLQLVKNFIKVKSDNEKYDDWEILDNEIDQLFIHGKVIWSQPTSLRHHG